MARLLLRHRRTGLWGQKRGQHRRARAVEIEPERERKIATLPEPVGEVQAGDRRSQREQRERQGRNDDAAHLPLASLAGLHEEHAQHVLRLVVLDPELASEIGLERERGRLARQDLIFEGVTAQVNLD